MEGKPVFLSRILRPCENGIYKLLHINANENMEWKKYLFCALAFNLVGLIFLFAILMLQGVLSWNPQGSQAAPKQAGTNGGGIVGTNSAHPFENPNALTNLFEMTLLLLIPVALCFSFGKCVKDKRQGIAIFLAMVIMLVVALGVVASCKQAGIFAVQTPARLFGTTKHRETAEMNFFQRGTVLIACRRSASGREFDHLQGLAL